MATTYGGYAFKTGSFPSEHTDAGFVVLSQRIKLDVSTFAGGATANAAILLPVGSQVLDYYADTTVAFTGTTGVNLVISNSSAAGADYVSSSAITNLGRNALTVVAAGMAMSADIPESNKALFIRAVANVVPTAGSAYITVTYVQKV